MKKLQTKLNISLPDFQEQSSGISRGTYLLTAIHVVWGSKFCP